MNKKTYLNNQYTLYQHSNKSPILQHQDFTFSLTPEGTIHLTTPSKEFDSTTNLFETIQYWKDSHYEYADILIGIEIDVDFWMDYYSNKYLRPYLTEYRGSKAYTNPLEQLGIPSDLTLPLTFSKRDEGYFMAISFSNDGFLESPIHTQVAEMPNNKVKLHSYYRMLCSLLYHSGYALTEDGKLYPNKCYILQDDHKALLEKLLQKMKEG